MHKKIRNLTDFAGNAALYRLDDGSFVIASSVTSYSGAETLVFPADSDGNVTDWCEIGGGRGYLNHEEALATL